MYKILFVVPDFYPSTTGFANASVGLVNSILKYGQGKYEIHVLAETKLNNEQKEFEGAVVHRYVRSKFDNRFTHSVIERAKYRHAVKLIDKVSFDLIFFETNTFPIFENLIVKRYKDKVCVRIHSTADTEVAVYGLDANLFQKRMKKKMFDFMNDVHGVIATSDFYLEFVKKHFYESNVYKIWCSRHFGLIFNTCQDQFKSFDQPSDNLFLTMGKLSNNGLVQKGFIDLLNSIEFLSINKKLPNDFKLVMIGDGEKFDFLKSYLETLDIRDRVVLVKKASHDDVFDYISKSKAIILLSRYEGQSMFITETISMGKPIIVTSNNGMSNMILDNQNGYSVEPGDILSISNAIYKMVNLDNDSLQQMGMKSRELFLQKFSEKAVYDQFEFFIKTC